MQENMNYNLSFLSFLFFFNFFLFSVTVLFIYADDDRHWDNDSGEDVATADDETMVMMM